LFRHQADHIEALLAAGDVGLAEEALERFDEQAATTKRPWAPWRRPHGVAASCARRRAISPGAVASLETAVVAHGNVDIPFELARTLLVKGQIHRRRKEKLLARDALLKSAEIFDRLGSRLWAERARVELGRVGSRKSDRHDLTVTEERVASLAASGLTNRVIAERAFLSPKTVEANLARVYQKLGINSRAQLGRAMGERERAAAK
jgi:DNA-binding CsgD family transcriptional regulator